MPQSLTKRRQQHFEADEPPEPAALLLLIEALGERDFFADLNGADDILGAISLELKLYHSTLENTILTKKQKNSNSTYLAKGRQCGRKTADRNNSHCTNA